MRACVVWSLVLLVLVQAHSPGPDVQATEAAAAEAIAEQAARVCV